MKIRAGFVSNSSSSSFILVLPDDFDTKDLKKIYDREGCQSELEYDDIVSGYLQLIKTGALYENDYCDEINALQELLVEYVVAGMEVSSERGEMILLDNKEIRRILNKEETHED